MKIGLGNEVYNIVYGFAIYNKVNIKLHVKLFNHIDPLIFVPIYDSVRHIVRHIWNSMGAREL